MSSKDMFVLLSSIVVQLAEYTCQINSNGCRRFYCCYGHNLDLEWSEQQKFVLFSWRVFDCLVFGDLRYYYSHSCSNFFVYETKNRSTHKSMEKILHQEKNWIPLGLALSDRHWITLSHEKKMNGTKKKSWIFWIKFLFLFNRFSISTSTWKNRKPCTNESAHSHDAYIQTSALTSIALRLRVRKCILILILIFTHVDYACAVHTAATHLATGIYLCQVSVLWCCECCARFACLLNDSHYILSHVLLQRVHAIHWLHPIWECR